MRVISKRRLEDFWNVHNQARAPLEVWLHIAKKAEWGNIDDVRRVFPSADPVEVRSGNMATVFNVGGNKFRLITAIHYAAQKLFILDVMTHAEYSKDLWKNDF